MGKLQYTGSIVIGDQKDRWQQVYFSQLYGTFFGIFAKFDLEHYEESELSCMLNEVEFKVINYKGILNLGITQVSDPVILDVKGQKGFKLFHFDIEVQAIYGSSPFRKVLDPPCNFIKGNTYFDVDRYLKPIFGHKTAERDGIFDLEFWAREGLDKPEEKTPAPEKWEHRKDFEALDDIEVTPLSVSICPHSTALIV